MDGPDAGWHGPFRARELSAFKDELHKDRLDLVPGKRPFQTPLSQHTLWTSGLRPRPQRLRTTQNTRICAHHEQRIPGEPAGR